MSGAKAQISLVAGLFIPTLAGVKTVLGFDPIPPLEVIGDIKVYSQEQDLDMAVKMARAVRMISGADIGIGTTAGVGEGGIAVVSDRLELTGTSSVYADLRAPDVVSILSRQESGIVRCLGLLEELIDREASRWQIAGCHVPCT